MRSFESEKFLLFICEILAAEIGAGETSPLNYRETKLEGTGTVRRLKFELTPHSELEIVHRAEFMENQNEWFKSVSQ